MHVHKNYLRTVQTDKGMPYTCAKCFESHYRVSHTCPKTERAEQVLTSAVGREGSAPPGEGSPGL